MIAHVVLSELPCDLTVRIMSVSLECKEDLAVPIGRTDVAGFASNAGWLA